jgi:hypothetical protein
VTVIRELERLAVRLRRTRETRERELERELRQQAETDEAELRRQEHQAEAQSAREIPGEEEWLTEVWRWPDEYDPGSLSGGVNGAQRRYLAERTALCEVDGRRVYGADIWSGARRQRKSSLIRALGARRCMAWPGYRYVQYLEDSTGSKLRPVSGEWGQAVGGLSVRLWREGWHAPPASSQGAWVWRYRHPSWPEKVVSTYELVGAGYSLQTADRRGRSGRIDLAHYSDAATYPHLGQLLSATVPTVPRVGGAIVAESTMPRRREGDFAQEFYATREQRSRTFLRAVWTAWYEAEHLRIPRNEGDWYALAMATEVGPAELDAEEQLDLDDEQVAFRRWYRCRGTVTQRRAGAREWPETPEETHELEGEPYLDSEVIERLRHDVRLPLAEVAGQPGRRRLSNLFSVSAWVAEPRTLLLGLDRAAVQGRDRTAVVGWDVTTREQVCELHGRCTDYQLAQALWEVLRWLMPGEGPGGFERGRCLIVPERNRCAGAIAEMLGPEGSDLWRVGGLPLYCDAGGRPGLYTDRNNRPSLLSAVIEAIDGGPDQRWTIRSGYLVDEIESLRPNAKRGGRLEGYPHDDLVIAAGEGLLVAPTVHLLPQTGAMWTPRATRSRAGRPA